MNYFRCVLSFLILFFITTVSAYAGANFSKIVVFGDSNTDIGTDYEGSLYNLIGHEYFQDLLTDYEGRNCNGPVVVEYAADALDVPLENYSVSGATTGLENVAVAYFNDIVGLFPQIANTGVLSQLVLFEESLEDRFADHRALYIIWAGSNDLFAATLADAVPRTAVALENIEKVLVRLTELGARNILVATRTTRPVFDDENNISGVMFNAALRSLVVELRADLESDIQIFDAFDFITDMMFFPDIYGFVETEALCKKDADCAGDLNVAAGYIQWDDAHKTTRVHELLAEKLVEQASAMKIGYRKGY